MSDFGAVGVRTGVESRVMWVSFLRPLDARGDSSDSGEAWDPAMLVVFYRKCFSIFGSTIRYPFSVVIDNCIFPTNNLALSQS